MHVNSVARIASLIGEPARTAMLLQLMDGRALTANELARAAGVSPATASRHLALRVEGELLQVTAIGRHRYHRIASAQVAALPGSLVQLAGEVAPVHESPADHKHGLARPAIPVDRLDTVDHDLVAHDAPLAFLGFDDRRRLMRGP